MATRAVKRRTTAEAAAKKAFPARLVGDPDGVAGHLRQFLTLKIQSDVLGERLSTLKKGLQQVVEAAGYEDDKGNFWLDLEEPVAVEGYGVCTRLKRERRVSQQFDEDAAEEILKAKALYETCTTMIPVFDEEEIRKAHFKGLLTDEEVAQIYPSKVTYAFKQEKA